MRLSTTFCAHSFSCYFHLKKEEMFNEEAIQQSRFIKSSPFDVAFSESFTHLPVCEKDSGKNFSTNLLQEFFFQPLSYLHVCSRNFSSSFNAAWWKGKWESANSLMICWRQLKVVDFLTSFAQRASFFTPRALTGHYRSRTHLDGSVKFPDKFKCISIENLKD